MRSISKFQSKPARLINKSPDNTISAAAAAKRKRKNRTAFTANQIFELEKRFSNQRYLSPHDRDRIAYELSLSTAQVITWFQNRRAKYRKQEKQLQKSLPVSMHNQVGNEMMRNIYQTTSRQYQYPVASQVAMNNAISGIGRYTAAQMNSMAVAAAGSPYMASQFSSIQSAQDNPHFNDHLLHYQPY